MPTVQISREHDDMIEEYLDKLEEEFGVHGTKKSLVERSIEKMVED